MSIYLRPRVTGARVFFTVNLARRGGDLLVREIDLLRLAAAVTLKERPVGVEAWVVLPDHMHCIWAMPAGDRDYGRRWGAIKARFTISVKEKYRATAEAGCRPGLSPAYPEATRLPVDLPVVRAGRSAGLKPGLRVAKREGAIWQRRFWEHHIRNDADMEAHLRYCWAKPVKHGLVERPEDWPFSSFHRETRVGSDSAGLQVS